MLVGQEVQVEMAANSRTVSREMFVTEEKLAGKRLMDLHVWDRYAVIVTRIRRAGVEITPVGTSTLELGDTLRVVGDDAALNEFARLVGGNTRKIDETNMVPFLIGILLGIVVGLIPIPLPNGLTIKLGAAGGALLVSLLLGHFGRIGPFPLYVPVAARNISRELGLMLFLAGAGANAGGAVAEGDPGAGRRRVPGGRGDHGGGGRGRRARHPPGLQDEPAFGARADERRDDQPACAGRGGEPDRDRRARGHLRRARTRSC